MYGVFTLLYVGFCGNLDFADRNMASWMDYAQKANWIFFKKNDKFSFANFENITTDTLNKLPIERHFASIKVLVSLGTNQDLEVEEIAVTETVAKTAGLHPLDFMCLISNPKEQISRA